MLVLDRDDGRITTCKVAGTQYYSKDHVEYACLDGASVKIENGTTTMYDVEATAERRRLHAPKSGGAPTPEPHFPKFNGPVLNPMPGGDPVFLDGEYWEVECGAIFYNCDTDPADGGCEAHNTFGSSSCNIKKVVVHTE